MAPEVRRAPTKEEQRIPAQDLRAVEVLGPCKRGCDKFGDVHYTDCPHVNLSRAGIVLVAM